MSYAICHVVCGYEMPAQLDNMIEDEPPIGFQSFYSGNGPSPFFCGVEVSQFDECTNVPVKDFLPLLRAQPTHIRQAQEEMEQAIEGIKEYFAGNHDDCQLALSLLPTEPDLILIWGSS